MYLVLDEECRETIFKTCSSIGGKLNKYRAQQKFEHKMNNGTNTQIYVLHNDMSFYGLSEHAKIQKK